MKRLTHLCFTLTAAAILGGCSLTSKIPGIGKKDGDGEEEVIVTPANGVAYKSDRALQTGDVVGVEVYKGLRSSDGLFDEVVTVGGDGVVKIGKYGEAKIGGLKVSAAASAIEATFRKSAKMSGARLTVHIPMVNGTGVVRLEGGVARPGAVILQEGMSVKDAIGLAGGKKRAGSGTSFVYVSSRGVRKTLVIDGVTGGNPEMETKLRAGDVVEVPEGL